MENNRICICPKCRAWFVVNKKNQNPICPDCHIDLKCTNISNEQFESMKDTDKEILERNLFKETVPKNESPNKAKQEEKPVKETKDSSPWITIMETVCIVILGVFMIGGIFFIRKENIIVGILVFALSTLIGFILISGMMVFTGMARDLRAIRNELENNKDR